MPTQPRTDRVVASGMLWRRYQRQRLQLRRKGLVAKCGVRKPEQSTPVVLGRLSVNRSAELQFGILWRAPIGRFGNRRSWRAVHDPYACAKRKGALHEPAVPERGSVTRRTWGCSDALRLTEPRSHRVVRFMVLMHAKERKRALHEPTHPRPLPGGERTFLRASSPP